MYQQAQQAQQAAGGDQTGAAGQGNPQQAQKPDDNVVDADYKVVDDDKK